MQNVRENPFNISFGSMPACQVARRIPLEEILQSFRNDESGNHVYMITGIRGSGKTVLMTEAARSLQESPDWILIDLNPNRDMLLGLAGKLYAVPQAQKLFVEAELNLSLFGFGVSLKNAPLITDIEAAIEQMLLQLKKHGKRVLITVDEAVNNKYVRVFASSFQSFLRADLPVYLLMTGLYDNINNLQNEMNLTFLYRAPKIHLEPLNMAAILNIYQKVFGNPVQEAAEMARLTKGYSFAFQLLGYLCWKNEQKWDRDEILPRFDEYLEEYSYEKIWSELSATDQKIAASLAQDLDNTEISHVRQSLQMSPQLFYKYKTRLRRKGLISENKSRELSFALPRFREFIQRQLYFSGIE